MNYAINFKIPQGPTGPAGGIAAFGGLYNDSTDDIEIKIGEQTKLPLPNEMPNANITYNNNSIEILESGIYEINYFSSVTVSISANVTLAVRKNGENIPAAILTRSLSIGSSPIYSGSVIVELDASDILDLAISSGLGIDVNLPSGVNTTLSVKKIS